MSRLVDPLAAALGDLQQFIDRLRSAVDVCDPPSGIIRAYTRHQDVERVLAAGYQVHIGKPVEPEALARAVAALAGRARSPGRARPTIPSREARPRVAS